MPLLAAVLLSALVAGMVASVTLLATTVYQRSRSGRGVIAVVACVALPAAPAAMVAAVGGSPRLAVSSGLICAAAAAGWLGKTRRWTVAAHTAWVSAVTAGAAFLAYTAIWTVSSGLSVAGVVGAVLLWLLEAAAFLLALFYLWELIDALGSRRWSKAVAAGPGRLCAPDGAVPVRVDSRPDTQ